MNPKPRGVVLALRNNPSGLLESRRVSDSCSNRVIVTAD